MTIRYANDQDGPALRALWEQGFGSDEPYTGWYFSHVYQPQLTLVQDEAGQLRSSLQLAPYQLCLNGETCPAAFIVGVVTDRDWQGHGLSSALLRRALADVQDMGVQLTLLYTDIPDFYARLGFSACYHLRRLSFAIAATQAGDGDGRQATAWRQARAWQLRPDELRQCDSIYRQMCAPLQGYVLRQPQNWLTYLDDWLSEAANGLYISDDSYLLTDVDSSGFRLKELGYRHAAGLRCGLRQAARLAAAAGFDHFSWDAPQTAPLPPQPGERLIPWVMARVSGWSQQQSPQQAIAATQKLLAAPRPQLWIGEMT